MNRECPKHDLVKFNKCITTTGERWRCGTCQVEAVTKRRRELKTLSIEYKGGECEDCGYSRTPSALEFHHIDPVEKEFAIGGNGKTRSFDSIKIELDKCLLLCANCHREEHDYLDTTGAKISLTGIQRSIGHLFSQVSS